MATGSGHEGRPGRPPAAQHVRRFRPPYALSRGKAHKRRAFFEASRWSEPGQRSTAGLQRTAIHACAQFDRETSSGVGKRPLGVSLSTTPGSSCDNCAVNSCSDNPDLAARTVMSAGPRADPSCEGEIGWFWPGPTHDFATSAWPLCCNRPSNPPSPASNPPSPDSELPTAAPDADGPPDENCLCSAPDASSAPNAIISGLARLPCGTLEPRTSSRKPIVSSIFRCSPGPSKCGAKNHSSIDDDATSSRDCKLTRLEFNVQEIGGAATQSSIHETW